jgi:hypothetical protein
MQWKCKTCGNWVGMAWATHTHVTSGNHTLEEMIKAREAGIDATSFVLHQERWTPAHETRKAPVDGV